MQPREGEGAIISENESIKSVEEGVDSMVEAWEILSDKIDEIGKERIEINSGSEDKYVKAAKISPLILRAQRAEDEMYEVWDRIPDDMKNQVAASLYTYGHYELLADLSSYKSFQDTVKKELREKIGTKSRKRSEESED